MGNDAKVYDSDQITLDFMGIPIDSGYGDGEFARVTPMTAAFTSKVGTDGEVTRSKTNDKRGTILVTLSQTSDGNARLSALYNLDVASPNGAGVGPMLIRDRSGTTLLFASKCWIAKRPETVFAREPTDKQWTLECADLDGLDGGN